MQRNNIKKVKNSKIQVLRAVSIVAVVLIHTCPVGEVQVYVRPFINFGVATFLFLSGYLTNLSKIKIKQFYKKRIIRVLIPYIIWTILYTTVSLIASGEMDIKRYFINLVTAGAAATLYYIFVYIQFVLLTPLIGKLLYKPYWWVGLLVTPLALLIKYYWLFSGTEPNSVVSVIWSNCCLGWFLFYYLGLYFGNVVKRCRFNVTKLVVIYLVSIAVQVAEGYSWYKMGETNCGTQMKLSAVITNSTFVVMTYCYIKDKRYSGDNKLLVMIGDYSFGIYLVHLMILTVLGKVVPFWGSVPFVVNSIIVLTISMLLVVGGRKVLGEKVSGWLGLC